MKPQHRKSHIAFWEELQPHRSVRGTKQDMMRALRAAMTEMRNDEEEAPMLRIVLLYYGIGARQHTLKEIGEQLGLKTGQAHRLRVKGFRFLSQRYRGALYMQLHEAERKEAAQKVTRLQPRKKDSN